LKRFQIDTKKIPYHMRERKNCKSRFAISRIIRSFVA